MSDASDLLRSFRLLAEVDPKGVRDFLRGEGATLLGAVLSAPELSEPERAIIREERERAARFLRGREKDRKRLARIDRAKGRR